jgi:hypothetical protein
VNYYTYKITAVIGYDGVDLDEEYAVYADSPEEAKAKANIAVKKLFPAAEWIKCQWTGDTPEGE